MRSRDLTLAIDVGTGGVRSALVDQQGTILALEHRPHEQIVPRYGWSEQLASQWWAGTVSSTRAVLDRVPGAAGRVAAVAVCGQMHGTVLLDEAGELARDAVPLWNDKRAQELVDEFSRDHAVADYLPLTANPPAAPWPAFKLQWFQRHEPETYRRTATVLMPKDFINFRLTGERAFDLTEASLSYLMDPVTCDWSPRMVSLLGLDRAKLPPIRKPTDLLGAVTARAASQTGLLEGTPVVVGASDYPMALLGSGACRPGRGSDVTGTSSIITVIAERPMLHPEVTNTATPNGLWGGFVLLDSGGDAMRWARRAFHENAVGYDTIVAKAAEAPPGSSA
jgi:xylulokinase